MKKINMKTKNQIERLSEVKSEQMTRRLKNNPNSVYSDCKSGKREDLEEQFFRSSWEANYARYLNFMGVEWEYEPKEFEFEEIKRGTRFYLPDFYLPDEDKWVEVKGYLRPKAKTALKRFMKYYPGEAEKLILVIKKQHNDTHLKLLDIGYENFEFYREIKDKVGGLIDNWE